MNIHKYRSLLVNVLDSLMFVLISCSFVKETFEEFSLKQLTLLHHGLLEHLILLL